MPHGQLVQSPNLRSCKAGASRRRIARLLKLLQLLYALACIGVVAVSLATIAGLSLA